LKENIKKLNIVIENQLARTIKITFRDKDPIKVSDVVNTIAEEFLKYDVDRKKRSTAGILKFIDKQSALVYEKLNYLDRQIKKIQQDNNFFTETTNEILPNIYLNKLNLLEDRILDLGYERSALQRISDILENQKSINVYEIIGLLTGIESENLLMSILNNLQELFSKRQSLLNDITDNNLKIKLIDKQIAQQKQEILKLVNSILIRIDQELADVKNKVTGYKNKLNIKGFDEMEFSRLQRLYTVNEKYYNQLLEKKAEYMIYEAGYVSNDVILEKASPAKYPISPIKTQIFVALFIVSFVVIFIYLIFRYLFFDQIVSIEDILDFTEVPLLGVIPLIKMNESVSNLVIEDGNNSIVSEAFRSMRTNLFFFKQIKGKQIISITSTVAGEGKTFIAINLSAIIAKSGKKVILLDLDMRKPRLHLSFNSKNEIGMSNLLIGDNSLEECIHSGPISNLDFITTGPIPPNPSELVVRPEMDIILSELKKHYDVIIMDTPPVGLVADAFVNFKKADYPIYVLRANYSKKTFINNINLIREEKKIDSISLVLNAYEVNDAEYGYGYGYGYG
ncbi:MAG TPA: polysaccharide biosynthesis tyrosine autokinase, partial [Bacteroidales bacterium]|nr:polysaccharide biosynthesis tyrosine autokinase [Bacteroidales bacterium]